MQKIIGFGISSVYIRPRSYNVKIDTMAKIAGPLDFNGKLGEISAYKMRGCERTVLRMSYGPSSEAIKTKPSYGTTRRNNKEFGGRSKASHWINEAIRPLKRVIDYNLSAALNGSLKPVQEADTESEYGKRNVVLWRKPFLLEGMPLNRRYSFDSVITSPLTYSVDKETGKAFVAFPQLVTLVNFFPPPNFSLCRLSAVLGTVPDIFLTRRGYSSLPGYTNIVVEAHSE